MADAHANFAYSTVATAPSPATSGTSLTVASGDGALFPAAPFNATVWPAGSQPSSSNAEIVRVTAVSTDTLTITRAQEGTSARSIGTGDQIAATITAKTLTDAEGDDQIDYVPKASDVVVTATSATSANTIIDGSAVTYDGSTRVKIEFWCRLASINAAGYWIVTLWDGTTDLGRLAQFHGNGVGDGTPVYGVAFITPTSGSHTYHVKAWLAGPTSSTFTGNSTDPGYPMWLRIRKS